MKYSMFIHRLDAGYWHNKFPQIQISEFLFFSILGHFKEATSQQNITGIHVYCGPIEQLLPRALLLARACSFKSALCPASPKSP